jgi:UDP-glucose 4-epimerase
VGGAGFIGSNLVDKLIKQGHDVIVLDNLSTGKIENVNKKANFKNVDITNLKQIMPYFKDIDYVFHLAALARVQPSIIDPIKTHNTNVTGTLNILWASYTNKIKKVIFSSSSSVYGDNYLPLVETFKPNPKSPYALHKYIGELYCRMFSSIYKLPTISLRYFNVYGPRQKEEGAYALVIAKFLRQKREGKPMTITGDGTQTRDFTHILDVVNANILAMKSGLMNGDIVNIGGGNNISVNKIAKLIGGKIKYIKPRLEPHDTLADIKKAKEELGWKPKVKIKKGIDDLKNYDN